MVTLKFKTNIKCGGCLAAVSPYLNNLPGVEKWNVDTASPDKILTVEAGGSMEEQIITMLAKAGYNAEKVY